MAGIQRPQESRTIAISTMELRSTQSYHEVILNVKPAGICKVVRPLMISSCVDEGDQGDAPTMLDIR